MYIHICNRLLQRHRPGLLQNRLHHRRRKMPRLPQRHRPELLQRHRPGLLQRNKPEMQQQGLLPKKLLLKINT
jgi:hypothetical protein